MNKQYRKYVPNLDLDSSSVDDVVSILLENVYEKLKDKKHASIADEILNPKSPVSVMESRFRRACFSVSKELGLDIEWHRIWQAFDEYIAENYSPEDTIGVVELDAILRNVLVTYLESE